MNVVELQRALRQLRCSGLAASLETRLVEAQAEKLAPIDFLSRLVQDELLRRQDRLLERRVKLAAAPLLTTKPRLWIQPASSDRPKAATHREKVSDGSRRHQFIL
jgi:hypothetical protein